MSERLKVVLRIIVGSAVVFWLVSFLAPWLAALFFAIR